MLCAKGLPIEEEARVALVAETLIEEWLNRNGYFTIRGAKVAGGGEIDLLGISLREDDAIHVEATVSADPMGYLTGGGLSKRTREDMRAEAKKWFVRKFQGRPLEKQQRPSEDRREELAPGRNWRFMLVYGDIKYPTEPDVIEELGVEVKHIKEIMAELMDRKRTFVTSSEASGIAELLDIFCKERGC